MLVVLDSNSEPSESIWRSLELTNSWLNRTDALLNLIIINAFRSGIVTRYCRIANLMSR